MLEFFSIENCRYAQFTRLAREPGLAHAFSTRPQDVSARRDGRQAERGARRAQMAMDLGFDPQRLCYCVQVHETRLAVIDRLAAGGPLEGIDAAVTNIRGVPLMTFSADCPLILAYDPVRKVVGVAHASWRCTTALTTRRLIQIMCRKCDCRPGDILAGVGPSAGPCCYEVKQDVWDAAEDLPDRDSAFQQREGRLYFDLWRANESLLLSAGVGRENIEIAGECTMCRNDVYYSFRKEKAGCGHFGLMAGLRAHAALGSPG